jgi:tagatose-6-phosphate ketose/aldose isomerase
MPGGADELTAADGGLAGSLRELADRPADIQTHRGYADTMREICQQPATWLRTAADMAGDAPRLAAFLEASGVSQGRGAIVLTGSGSSLYAAAAVGPALQAALRIPVHVFAAGDVLTQPERALPPTRPCVLVSFGRSGNSPESTAAIDLLLAREPECRHLIVTCCRGGRLATAYVGDPRVCTIVLDERTCDRSLVMTSSFTNMVIAANILGSLDNTDRHRAQVEAQARAAAHLLRFKADTLADLARRNWRTVFFLASGSRHGGAREASLKMTEMSDGRMLSFAETYLGVRHGPMSAIRDETLVVCFLSSDPRARAYEADLVCELSRKRLGSCKVLFGEAVPADLAVDGDVVVECPGMAAAGDDGAPVLDVLVGQLLAFFHCLHLGLRPDSPSASGVINRVVEPFTIHRQA